MFCVTFFKTDFDTQLHEKQQRERSARVTASLPAPPRSVRLFTLSTKYLAAFRNTFSLSTSFPSLTPFFGLRNHSCVVLLKRLALISAADETAKC